MFPVRYELNSYVNLLRNSVFEVLSQSFFSTNKDYVIRHMWLHRAKKKHNFFRNLLECDHL
jgi:hypothetical protein